MKTFTLSIRAGIGGVFCFKKDLIMEISRMVFPYKIQINDNNTVSIRQPGSPWQTKDDEDHAIITLETSQMALFVADIQESIEKTKPF